MKALSIAWKDMLILAKDRGSLLLLFVLPVIFILIFSGALAQLGQPAEEKGIPLPVVNLDADSAVSAALLDQVIAAGGIELVRYDEAEARTQLEANDIGFALFIPAGFGEDTAAGRPVAVTLLSHPDADASQVTAVRLIVEGVAGDMSLETQLIGSLKRMAAMQADSPGALAFTEERILGQARSQWEASRARPLIDMKLTEPGQLDRAAAAEEDTTPLGNVTVQVIGFTVLFVFLTGHHTARSIYDERKVGSFRRLLAAPMSKAAILAGKSLPNGFTGLLQIGVIFAVGVFVLPLLGMDGMSLGTDPLAVAVLSVLVVACSASLGVLIAALARTESQIGGISSLVVWGMGIVGGSFIPFYLLGDAFISSLGKLVPIYWANEGFFNVLVRGRGLTEIATEMAALLGFTILFLLIGLWRFDFD